MNNTGTKIVNKAKSTAVKFRSDCSFSLYYALLRLVDELGGRIGFKKLSHKAHVKKDLWIMRYLSKGLTNVRNRYRNDSNQGVYEPDAPIWVCWWTGSDTAPGLVQQCIKSIQKNAGTHPVYLITEENYAQYLKLPDCILNKVICNQIKLAHLADYIRVKLLAEHGGLWLDATIFCSQEIPSVCFELPVFTCKGPVRKSIYISDYRWCTFCLGGWKGNVFFRFLAAAFEEYWNNHKYAIDYLFFDYIIFLAYQDIPAITSLLNNIPDNNTHRDDLQAAMNAAVPITQMDQIIKADTVLYKLSWRETYQEKTSDGRPSIYAGFLEMTQ